MHMNGPGTGDSVCCEDGVYEHIEETFPGSPGAGGPSRIRGLARPTVLKIARDDRGSESRLQPLPKARAFMRPAESCFNFDVHAESGLATSADVISSCA